MKTFITNWQPQHFPQGTVVVLGNNINDGKTLHFSDKEFTVKSCSQTSLGDWLVITDTWNVMLEMWEPYNFASIVGIKKRGDGPVVATSAFFPEKPMRNLKKIVAYDNINKNKYICNQPMIGELFNHLVKKYLPLGLFTEIGFIHFFLRQTWVYKNPQDNSYSFSKKKANRFIKQNINRWIKPMKYVRLEFEVKKEQQLSELIGLMSLENFIDEIPDQYKYKKIKNNMIYSKEELFDIPYKEEYEFINPNKYNGINKVN